MNANSNEKEPASPVNIKWHTLSAQAALEQLGGSEQGLTQKAIAEKRAVYGLNELIERGVKSRWAILWEQMTAIMVVILIIAAIISAALGDYKDAIAIMAIVILNAILGFTQEYRAEKAMAALRKLAVPVVKVRRNGHVLEISARELVPGDIVLLEAGGFAPADARLLENINLRVHEAALTGESEPVEKHVVPLDQEHLPLGDRRNMIYMGTTITYGRGTAVVTEIGMNTELGRIAEMIQSVKRKPTPLQRRLEQLGRGLAVAAIALVSVVFVLGLLRGEDVKLMFLTAISMAVAAVPEGLPAVVTISLALGAQRMLKRRALIRKLPAVETLGSVTVICSDKTGTLTENRMTVTVLDVLGETRSIETLLKNGIPVLDAELAQKEKPTVRSLGLLLKSAALCNDAVLETNTSVFKAIGDPTEGAMVIAAARLGLLKNELDQRWPRVAETPFSSDRKRMSTVHRLTLNPDQTDAPWRSAPYVLFCKGAIDVMMDITTQVWSGDSAVPLTDEHRQRILDSNDRLAQDGHRVLGVAFRPLDSLPKNGDESALETKLTFIGLIAMIDPPRPEVKASVQTCRTAGIRPVMITGDHPLTAQYIARDLGIGTNGSIITGQELARMTDKELESVVEHVSVYARVSPEHKLRIVQALQEKGHIVSMTGDGVNDAPALKKADIGVAMGITGTDVSKEASDMVLLDDNFATIVAAVEEGRTIYDNIRKFIKYTMTSNSGEIWTMLFAPFLGMPLPLLPLQILWINLVTDGLPGLALAFEPAERDTMTRTPYHPKENIFGRGMGRHILWVGLLMGFVSLGMGFWFWRAEDPAWQTMVFTTLTLSQMGHALAIRSGKESLFTSGLFTNKALLGAVILTFALQMAVVYVPFMQEVFTTTGMSFADLAVSLALSTVVFWGVELEKWFLRRKAVAH
ncbi:MAG: cation-translocating P-type ATPase [Anaerolineae bacterium]|nr:cation-translocating P-type ATPase [Anaerolineae bacterium]